jgi:hypothetical protein
LESIPAEQGTGLQLVTLNAVVGASHWLHLEKFQSDPRVTSWTDESLDIYHYTVASQDVSNTYFIPVYYI